MTYWNGHKTPLKGSERGKSLRPRAQLQGWRAPPPTLGAWSVQQMPGAAPQIGQRYAAGKCPGCAVRAEEYKGGHALLSELRLGKNLPAPLALRRASPACNGNAKPRLIAGPCVVPTSATLTRINDPPAGMVRRQPAR